LALLESVPSSSLLVLNLDFNNIGGKGAKAIANYLSISAEFKLVTLSLSNNNLGSKGANLILKAMLSGNCKVKELKMQYNCLKNDFLPLAEETVKEAE
jgi:hypothetical protein